jgi:ABC-type sugar transport system permease subunit
MSSSKFKRNYYGYLFITPFIIGFLIFGLYPVYNTLALSFTDTTLMTKNADFVGLKILNAYLPMTSSQ